MSAFRVAPRETPQRPANQSISPLWFNQKPRWSDQEDSDSGADIDENRPSVQLLLSGLDLAGSALPKPLCLEEAKDLVSRMSWRNRACPKEKFLKKKTSATNPNYQGGVMVTTEKGDEVILVREHERDFYVLKAKYLNAISRGIHFSVELTCPVSKANTELHDQDQVQAMLGLWCLKGQVQDKFGKAFGVGHWWRIWFENFVKGKIDLSIRGKDNKSKLLEGTDENHPNVAFLLPRLGKGDGTEVTVTEEAKQMLHLRRREIGCCSPPVSPSEILPWRFEGLQARHFNACNVKQCLKLFFQRWADEMTRHG